MKTYRFLKGFVTVCLLMAHSVIHAATTVSADTTSINNTITNSSGNLQSAIENLIAGYGTKQINQLNAPTPFIGQSQALGLGQHQILNGNITAPFYMVGGSPGIPATAQNIVPYLNTADPLTVAAARVNEECPASEGIVVGSLKCLPQDISISNSKNLDMSSFINPLYYEDKGNSALSFINYVSGQSLPPGFKLSTQDFKDKLSKPDTYGTALTYLFTARNMAAGQTAGLNTLYRIYQERIPVKDLGKSVGLSSNDASPLQVDAYAAQRRITTPNSDWYNQMETASPATIQRETLYVLAEIRLELFKQRLELERMEALSAISLLQQNSTSGRIALQGAEMQLNGQIPGSNFMKDPNAKPNTPTTPPSVPTSTTPGSIPSTTPTSPTPPLT